MKTLDLSLYLVLDPDLCGSPAGMVRTARLAAENGATVVQLRAPQWKKKQWLTTAREIKAALSPLGVPLIVNDQIDVALAVDADGVHVGQSDMEADDVRKILGEDKILGVSAQTVEQAVLAEKMGADYLGVGAVFSTSTKKDASAISKERVKAICEAVHIPVIAIGGITADNILTLKGSGICGIAVVSAIFAAKDIEDATGVLLEKTTAMVNDKERH